MRTVTCTICNTELENVDLRASAGADPWLLQARELGAGFNAGREHLGLQHPETVALRISRNLAIDPLIRVSEFKPLDPQSRIGHTSRVRR